jgi:hypothetical protein
MGCVVIPDPGKKAASALGAESNELATNIPAVHTSAKRGFIPPSCLQQPASSESLTPVLLCCNHSWLNQLPRTPSIGSVFQNYARESAVV